MQKYAPTQSVIMNSGLKMVKVDNESRHIISSTLVGLVKNHPKIMFHTKSKGFASGN